MYGMLWMMWMLLMALSTSLVAWAVAFAHERGLSPAERLAALMRRPAWETVLLAMVAVGFIHHGATKGTNGVPDRSGVAEQTEPAAVPRGGEPDLPEVLCAAYGGTNDYSDVTNLCFTEICVVSNGVLLSAAWPTNWTLPLSSLLLYSRTNLSTGSWMGLATATVPDGWSAVDIGVPDGILPDGGMDRSFFALGTFHDTDGDGVVDSDEVFLYGTSPSSADTDGDGMNDGDEIAMGTNPLAADTDGDGLEDGEEVGFWEYCCPGLPVFDVSGGTNLLLSSKSYDNSQFVVPLPFEVTCAGVLHTNVTIGVNGLIGLMSVGSSGSFSSGSINHDLNSYTISQHHTAIAGYWDDLYATKNGGSQITVADVTTNGQRYCVIEYRGMQQYSARTNMLERGTFQIVIPQAETNVVYVHYIDMTPAFDGSSATIGAQLLKRLRNFPVSYNIGDSVTNGMVIAYRFGSCTDPLVLDTDDDGLNDGEEAAIGTCPWKFDTDGDDLSDGWEVSRGLDPLSSSGNNGADGDPDGDSLLNLKEYEYGTEPTLPDTDGDGLCDAEETGSISIATDGMPWLSFDVFEDLTHELASATKGCVTVELSSPISVQHVMITNLTVSFRGILFLDRVGYTNGGISTSGSSFSAPVDRKAFVIAPCFGNHNLYTNFPARSSSVRLGTATYGGEGYILAEWSNMYRSVSASSTNAISFQVAIPTNRADRAFVRYRDLTGTYMTGDYASIGMQTLDGRWLHSYCHHDAGKIWEGLSLAFQFGANSDPKSDDIDLDGLSDALEALIGTDPMQPDTDGDGMEDGWERRVGFDPRTHNGETERTDDDADADPDGDGLTNAEECAWDTNPSGADGDGDGVPDGYDTDGDGVSDGDEVNQSSDPSDAKDLGMPDSRIAVVFRFGDPSSSHSEKYRLEVEPISGQGERPSGYSWVNANYGQCEANKAMLKANWTYAVRMYHSGTSPQYLSSPRPDYDYSLSLPTELPANVLLHDPSQLFGGNGNSGESFTGNGKVAYIHVLGPPEISAPETVGLNLDDDNGNDTLDCEDMGEVVGDDDLVGLKVKVYCPPWLSGTATLKPYGCIINGKMWRDRARTQRVESDDTFPVNGYTEQTYYMEGDSYSVGHLTENVRAKFMCSEQTFESEHRFTFVYRIAEPITTERVGVNLVNPCCAIVGASTPMRIKVRPDGFPDSKIKWSVVSGAGTFASGDSGRDVTFVAGGNDGDSVTLQVDVGDCQGAPPQFTLRTTTMREVKIYPCAISDGENPSPITDAHVSSLLDGVNAIFRQVGLHFSLGASVTNVTNDVWARNGLIETGVGAQIRNVMSGTDGLEVYFIAGSGNGDEPVGLYNSYGIILRNSADAIVLAHEIGHSCGWPDIYFYRGSVIPAELNQELRTTWMPNDWNNGSGCRFYGSMLSQRDIIQRLLMNGVKTDAQSDIPLGGVFGLSVDSVTGMMNVGRNGILTVSPQSN